VKNGALFHFYFRDYFRQMGRSEVPTMHATNQPTTLDLLIAVRRLLQDADRVKVEYDRLIETAQATPDSTTTGTPDRQAVTA
jgi:hypothetical protein